MPQFIMAEDNTSHTFSTIHRLNFGTDESPLKYFLYRNVLNDGFVAILRPNPYLKLLATLGALVPECFIFLFSVFRRSQGL